MEESCLTTPAATASEVVTQDAHHSTPPCLPRIRLSCRKNLELTRQQYESPALISSSSESKIVAIQSQSPYVVISSASSTTIESGSSSKTPDGLETACDYQTSVQTPSSTSQYDATVSGDESTSASISGHTSRNETPTNPPRGRSRSPRTSPIGSGTNVSTH